MSDISKNEELHEGRDTALDDAGRDSAEAEILRHVSTVAEESSGGGSFPLEIIPVIESRPEHFRLLTRIPYTCFRIGKNRIKLREPAGDEKSMIILDTETTGLDFLKDRIIELAMVKVKYSPSLGVVTSIENIYDELEDPMKPLDPAVVKITGITDDDVKGKKIDDGEVSAIMADSPLIIAHNARFDRRMFEKRFAHLKHLCELPWGCTLSEINWNALDGRIFSKKQEAIALSMGYFYDAHRASTDCLALLWLLNCVQGALSMLLSSVDSYTYTIRALNAPYDAKDILKSRGYQWFDREKVKADSKSFWWMKYPKYWYKSVGSVDEYQQEVAFLMELYGMPINADNQQEFTCVDTAFTRYK